LNRQCDPFMLRCLLSAKASCFTYGALFVPFIRFL
jgi:hypothetical protein